jgi:hypothetical protein
MFKTWENRSNTIVSEKWNADITPSPTNFPCVTYRFWDVPLSHLLWFSLSCVHTLSSIRLLYHTTLRVEEPLNFKILLWWLSSNSKQKSIYLALIYSLSLGGGSACQFRANVCHKDSVRMWLHAQVTLKVFLRLWKVFLRLWRFSWIERFKVNKKVQRFKVTIWFLRRKVQS